MIVLSKKMVRGMPNHPIVFCPGCEEINVFDTRWKWNNDVEKPTFSPSLVISAPTHFDKKKRRCHSFLRDGIWEFLSDCTHDLSGKNVPIPDLPKWITDDMGEVLKQ